MTADAEELDLSRIRYRRGFLLTLAPHEAPMPHWSSLALPGAHLSYDSDLRFAFVQHAGHWLCLLGDAADVAQQQSDPRTLATSLLDALHRGREHFYEALDNVAGRFVVIDGNPQEVWLQTDATAARSAFHSIDVTGVAGSDLRLVAGQIDAKPGVLDRTVLKELGLRRPPGRLTSYDGLVALTPNLELELHTGSLRRVWPRQEITTMLPADSATAMVEPLQTHAQVLTATKPVYAPVRADVFSRALLGALRSTGTTFINYTLDFEPHLSKGVTNADHEVTKALAERTGIGVDVVSVPGPPPQEFRHAVNHNLSESVGLAPYAPYAAQLQPGSTWIRSDTFLLGRPLFKYKWADRQRFDVARMSAAVRSPGKPQPAVDTAFDDFAQASGYFDAVDMAYNPYDLLACEFRIGRRTSAELIADDSVYAPVQLGNTQCVLQSLISVATEFKRTGRVHTLLIEQTWPRLLEVPIGRAPKPDDDAWTLHRSAIRPMPETQPLPETDGHTGLPAQLHASVEDFDIPFSPGMTQHRIPLTPNDSRGEAFTQLFGPLDLEMLLDERSGDALVVVLHGATDRGKYTYPRFEWMQTLTGFSHGSVMWLADPTLRLATNLALGWYVGPPMIDVPRAAAKVVRTTAKAVGASKVIFVGSSGGGFAALAMSRHVQNSTAVAFSPQTDIRAYHVRSHVHRMLATAFPGYPSDAIAAAFGDRIRLIEPYAGPTPNGFRYVQNAGDPEHVEHHLTPFARACGLDPVGDTSPDGTRTIITRPYADGHRPPSSKLFLREITAAIERS